LPRLADFDLEAFGAWSGAAEAAEGGSLSGLP
jgi:hypothetical protein